MGAVLCVVRSSEAFVVRSEALRSLAPLRIWMVLSVRLEQSLEYRRYHSQGQETRAKSSRRVLSRGRQIAPILRRGIEPEA